MIANSLTCLAGVVLLIAFSFVLTFFRSFRLAYSRRRRLKRIRKKYRMNKDLKTAHGNYEEVLNRMKAEEAFTNSRPTII
jgi:hypothetical protein